MGKNFIPNNFSVFDQPRDNGSWDFQGTDLKVFIGLGRYLRGIGFLFDKSKI